MDVTPAQTGVLPALLLLLGFRKRKHCNRIAEGGHAGLQSPQHLPLGLLQVTTDTISALVPATGHH